MQNERILPYLPVYPYLRIFFQVCYSYTKKITASLDVKFIIACAPGLKHVLATQI